MKVKASSLLPLPSPTPPHSPQKNYGFKCNLCFSIEAKKRPEESTAEEKQQEQQQQQPKAKKKKKEKTVIDEEKEAAIAAEVKAARERALVPLEIRMKQFKDMLLERGVSSARGL